MTFRQRLLALISVVFVATVVIGQPAAVASQATTYAYDTASNTLGVTTGAGIGDVVARARATNPTLPSRDGVSAAPRRFVAAETAATATEQVVVRGGADLAKVTGQDQAAIQSAATRIGKPISLVGSRSTGNISMASDYDYVVTGATKEDIAILRKALPSTYMGIGEPPGIDIFTSGLQPGMPYITFNP
jgi:hypothetical protein